MAASSASVASLPADALARYRAVLCQRRTIFEPQHEAYRIRARAFCESIREAHAQAEKSGAFDPQVFRRAAVEGFYCAAIPTEYGGHGLADFRYNAIVNEEMYRAGVSGWLSILGSDMVLSYFLRYASPAQKAVWLPRIAKGQGILAVAMSEPELGSDLAGMATSATRDGDFYVLNGRKMWISNGSIADLVVVAVRTDPTTQGTSGGISLVVVDTHNAPGFRCVRVLNKMAHPARDVCELEFKNVRVPVAHRLGDEGTGFRSLMHNLAQERLSVSVSAIASCEVALDQTLEYVTRRIAFGQRLGDMQHIAFQLADCVTDTQVGRVFIDHCIMEHVAGRLSPQLSAMAKLWSTKMQHQVLDTCVQLHGAFGVLADNETGVGPSSIGRHWANERVQPIYAGTNEIMKSIIAQHLGLAARRRPAPQPAPAPISKL